MRTLIARALLGVLLGCVPQPPESATSATPFATASQQAAVSAPCAQAIPTRGSATVKLTELPHQIGGVALFGLDGSFVASAYPYPLGAQWQWWELDANGTLLRQFEWRWQGGMLQSPDGSKVVYGRAVDSATATTALFVRDTSNSAGRPLAPIHGTPLRWLDADHVLVEPFDATGVMHSIDTRTGADQIVFSPPLPPTVKAEGDNDWFYVSGDLRWAVFVRSNAAGSLLRQDLFDLVRQSYVPGVTLGANAVALAPVGDIALWIEGNQLRAMHLCDRRVVNIGTVAASSNLTSVHWNSDGRLAALSFGETTEQTGPERIVFVDVQTGAIADTREPWGVASQWSPDGRFVVLTRSGFHGPISKLAKFEFN